MEFKKMKASDYKLVISTIPIPDYPMEYIVVSPMLNKDEIEKIRSSIHKHKILTSSDKSLSFTVNEPVSNKTVKSFIKEMQIIQKYTETISEILEGFELIEIRERKTTEEILSMACQRLFEKQVIEQVDAVVESLKRREQIGGLGIPETSMALFHTRSDYAIKPSFTIYALENPVRTAGMDQGEMEVKFLLLMISPEEPSDKVLEVLSYLSSLLIESEESIAAFQSNDEGEILSYLSSRFQQFFTEKLNLLRSV